MSIRHATPLQKYSMKHFKPQVRRTAVNGQDINFYSHHISYFRPVGRFSWERADDYLTRVGGVGGACHVRHLEHSLSYSKNCHWVISWAMNLTQQCCHCSKHFLELLTWNSFQCRPQNFFRCLQYLKYSSLLRQTLFLEKDRSHSEPNQEKSVGVPFQ
jgi:hypothetical protein